MSPLLNKLDSGLIFFVNLDDKPENTNCNVVFCESQTKVERFLKFGIYTTVKLHALPDHTAFQQALSACQDLQKTQFHSSVEPSTGREAGPAFLPTECHAISVTTSLCF